MWSEMEVYEKKIFIMYFYLQRFINVQGCGEQLNIWIVR